MNTILETAQIITALILIGLILLQSQEGLSTTLWGEKGYQTKRGLERMVVIATAIFGALFLALSLLGTIV